MRRPSHVAQAAPQVPHLYPDFPQLAAGKRAPASCIHVLVRGCCPLLTNCILAPRALDRLEHVRTDVVAPGAVHQFAVRGICRLLVEARWNCFRGFRVGLAADRDVDASSALQQLCRRSGRLRPPARQRKAVHYWSSSRNCQCGLLLLLVS